MIRQVMNRRYCALLIFSVLASGLLVTAGYWLYPRVFPPPIHVRWAPNVLAGDQKQAEQQFHLQGGTLVEGRTRSYGLRDDSYANIKGLINDPRVEDTHGLDRTMFQRISPEVGFANVPWGRFWHSVLPLARRPVLLLAMYWRAFLLFALLSWLIVANFIHAGGLSQ